MRFNNKHEGHTCTVAHLRLREEQREVIAGMLSAGIPFDDVLDRVQLSTSNLLSPISFLSKKDLLNIRRDFNVEKIVSLHSNDADSVAAWVAKNRQDDGEKSVVRYVKFQGEEGEFGLRQDDFMLILMTQAQIAGVQKFGGEGREVALDSTHGTNAYNFQLTTLMVLDEHGEGFPGAFCYSNRVDECTMSMFLGHVRDALGCTLQDVVLMTDDAEVYSNAWNRVMGLPAQRVLCTWHVDRAWRKNLGKVKGDYMCKVNVYKTLRALMELRDKESFKVRLEQFMRVAKEDEKTSVFAAYFEAHYASRPSLWAYSHRLGLGVHHNMHLEAMHRVLKHVHMEGRKVRRMDKSIHALMKLLRAKMRDRLLKLHKGKWNRHLLGIRRRHQVSRILSPSLAMCVEENITYAVKSTSEKQEYSFYLVERSNTVPHEKTTCALMCEDCKVCVHTFMCNCEDSGLRNSICKHIHLVMRVFKPQLATSAIDTDVISPETEAINQCYDIHSEGVNSSVCSHAMSGCSTEECSAGDDMPLINESAIILQDLSKHSKQSDLQKCYDTAKQHVDFLFSEMYGDPEMASVVVEQLARARALVIALKNKPQLPRLSKPMTSEPANKLSVHQRRFITTKTKSKKRKPEMTMSRPSAKEKEHLLNVLGGDVENVSCDMTNTDHDYNVSVSDVITFEHSYMSVG